MTLLLLLRSSEPATTPYGTYSWKVRATDEHGMAGSWSSADTFTVTQAGSVPTCELVALANSTTTTPRSTWTYYDADGDAQTDYEIEVASDDGFSSIVQDSGQVTSTAQYYDHAALVAGTYYRRLKVQTASTDWSEWSATSAFTIVAATSQTEEWDIYLDAGGTPAILAPASYPVTGVEAIRRLDGPSTFKFVVDNFDGLEGGIADDEDILLYLKDTAGKRIEFRGEVTQKQVGLFVEVTCEDIARKFAFWPVTRSLDNVTLGECIAAIVGNPTGNASTGIVCHCEEVPHPVTTGDVVRVIAFSGQSRTVAEWLTEFGNATGFRWHLESIAGTWHFYWYDALSAPVWACVLKDSIDYKDESATQARVLGTPSLTRNRQQYINRVRYAGRIAPPSLPEGYTDFDSLMSETVTDWRVWSDDFTLTADDTAAKVKTGSYSIKCEYAFTGVTRTAFPQTLPFCYWLVPDAWRNMTDLEFGDVLGHAMMTATKDAVAFWPVTGGAPRYNLTMWAFDSLTALAAGVNTTTKPYTYAVGTTLAKADYTTEWSLTLHKSRDNVDWSNVVALGFGLQWYPSINQTNAAEYVFTLWLDGLHIIGNPSYANRDVARYIESAEVTAGTEIPIERIMGGSGISLTESEALARNCYSQFHRTQTTVSNLALAGVRNIPLRNRVAVVLTSNFALNDNYPLVEVQYKPAQQDGWTTTLVIGDKPLTDYRRSIINLVNSIGSAKAEATK